MRIAIASDDGAHLASHTGRCAGFVIYQIEGQSAERIEYRPNTFTAHARGECGGHEHGHDHDAGHAAHSHGPLVAAVADCQVLISRGLGPRLVADLGVAGVDAYACAVDETDDAARQYAEGRLPRLRGGCCCHPH